MLLFHHYCHGSATHARIVGFPLALLT